MNKAVAWWAVGWRCVLDAVLWAVWPVGAVTRLTAASRLRRDSQTQRWRWVVWDFAYALCAECLLPISTSILDASDWLMEEAENLVRKHKLFDIEEAG